MLTLPISAPVSICYNCYVNIYTVDGDVNKNLDSKGKSKFKIGLPAKGRIAANEFSRAFQFQGPDKVVT
jgi:hypothetical protein